MLQLGFGKGQNHPGYVEEDLESPWASPVLYLLCTGAALHPPPEHIGCLDLLLQRGWSFFCGV